MYRQKIQDLKSEIIGLISLKVGFILKDQHSQVNLLSSFRINNSIDFYDVVNSLGISGDKICFITDYWYWRIISRLSFARLTKNVL